jgi:hypothetical protein
MATKEIINLLEKYVAPFRITKGEGFRLKDIDPSDTCGLRLEKVWGSATSFQFFLPPKSFLRHVLSQAGADAAVLWAAPCAVQRWSMQIW